jgi:hypothetical protein
MTRVLATLTVIGAAAMLASACVQESNWSADLGPDAPACTVVASTDAKDACVRFQAALCAQAVGCDLFAALPACVTWFTATYGDCELASAKPALTDDQNTAFVACLCGLPNASCRSLGEGGVEVSVPTCAKF